MYYVIDRDSPKRNTFGPLTDFIPKNFFWRTPELA